MAPASLPRTRSERQDAKSLRPHLPSIVEIIDRRDPDYAQLAEFNLPTRSKVTGRTREVGIGDRSGFRHFPGRSLFVYIRSFLEEKNRKVSEFGAERATSDKSPSFLQAQPASLEADSLSGKSPRAMTSAPIQVSCGTVEGHGTEQAAELLRREDSRLSDVPLELTIPGASRDWRISSSGYQAPPPGIHVYPSVPSLIRSAEERKSK